MNSIHTIIFILGWIIGTLFGIGVTDWHLLLKDEYKITDWIIAICTILIVMGTSLATIYTKKSAYYAKKQFFSNNLPLAQEIYSSLVSQLQTFSYNLNDRCREIRNLVNKRYEPHSTIQNITSTMENTLSKLSNLKETIEKQKNQLSFLMQSNDFNNVTAPLFLLELNLKNFLDLYKIHPNNIEDLRKIAKQILDCNNQLIEALNPIKTFFQHYFQQTRNPK
ncbi:hypothetical protein HV560_02360 [Mannheimia pernigra]|uniref:Uncharacterized protein n=1 Tax=Mannheimia pernigra TaxID=111844 RepID=A0ABD7A6K7_9PAST|nr:hypothetical protein [Mannheimia pernigra]QLB41761.1 hypothetical protein HV560_02360 [Mannheimia pernigra]